MINIKKKGIFNIILIKINCLVFNKNIHTFVLSKIILYFYITLIF